MSKILGLDVSTSATGVTIIDTDHDLSSLSHIVMLSAIELHKCKSIWEKADKVQQFLVDLKSKHVIDRIAIEEPLMGFRPGMSSAQTISALLRFNGIVSYLSRDVFKQTPEYINASHARKLCGIKLQKTAIGGPQKAQVFKYFSEHDLKHIDWQKKKNGKIVDWAMDATDSYCIAKACAIST